MYKITFLALLALSAFSCGEEAQSETLETTVASIPSSEKNPCDYLTESYVKKTFDIQPGVEVTFSDDYNTCSYSWDALNEAEREIADQESLDAVMNSMKNGEKLSMMDAQKGYFSVSLNFTTAKIDNKAQAEAVFSSINRSILEGIKVSAETIKESTREMGIDDQSVDKTIGEGVTFKGGKSTIVNGVGDQAVWDAKLKQLRVLSGTDVFFVNLDAGGDKAMSITKAQEVAQDVISLL